MTAITLNRAPISPSPSPASRAKAESTSAACCGVRVALERFGALEDAELLQEFALLDRTVDQGVGGGGGARQRREIDMGGQVGKAGLGERIDELMGLDRLQGLAETGAPIAIIDGQSRAVIGHDVRGDPRHQPVRGGAEFENGARRAPRP